MISRSARGPRVARAGVPFGTTGDFVRDGDGGGDEEASAPSTMRSWTRVTAEDGPCQRSLHVAAICGDRMFCFGGYDGSNRVNDCWEFDFGKRAWSAVAPTSGTPPTPRDRHVAVVYDTSFYVFAGFDGTSRVNDFHGFSLRTAAWTPVRALSGTAPSPRHSHAAVVYESSLYVFGGYDGSYRCDFHEYNFATSGWTQMAENAGRVPRARYRATCVVHEANMYLFGGHDGTRHLNDVHTFDFNARAWSSLQAEGPAPIPRDSHVAVAHGDSMFVFGGSTGSAMNDFHELRLDARKWSPVQASGYAPGHRFCHVAVVHKDSLYVFGGYDGSNRLNDFLEFKFGFGGTEIPASSLINDLKGLLSASDDGDDAGDALSDVTFLVDGRRVRAHKVLCMRCPYFKALLAGRMREATQAEVAIEEVRHPIFLALLEYLYTDQVDIPLDIAMELFEAADRFGVDRLKRMCESKMLASIHVENAATIFHAADSHAAKSLREKCLTFILTNFDAVTRTASFEEMGRTNVELVFEILKSRNGT